MYINELIGELEQSTLKRVVLVLIEDDGTRKESGFSHEGSWRGSYNQPCIFMGDNTDKNDLIQALRRLKSETYEGWKGGEYNYGGYDNLEMEEHTRDWTGDGDNWDVVEDKNYGCIEITCIKNMD